jgi:predicted ester cyclase
LVNHAFGGAFDREAWRDGEKKLMQALDDYRLEVFDQVAEGDKVATRFAITGRHVREYYGVPPKGATASLDATVVDRVSDGQIIEHWADADSGGFRQQLTGTES